MNHPELLRPETLAQFNTEKMGKSTIFMSERMLVGLNAFEPGQEHALHGHANQDKVYHVPVSYTHLTLPTICSV